MLRVLVLDAYPPEGRDDLRRAGATLAGELYASMLRRLRSDVQIDVAYPADASFALPDGNALSDYDGVAWTGSSLTIHHQHDARVIRQIELARRSFDLGLASFGSCWAVQLACVAAGGRCAPNPRGREFGIARKIRLSDTGRAHPMYRGKSPCFDAFTSHQDEVTELPAGDSVQLLASNDFSRVQAVSIARGDASFWALQYHPEYDLHEVARLCVLRAPGLIAQRDFRDQADADAYVDKLEALHGDPARRDLAFGLAVDADVLDADRRQIEVRNWLEIEVQARAAKRA